MGCVVPSTKKHNPLSCLSYFFIGLQFTLMKKKKKKKKKPLTLCLKTPVLFFCFCGKEFPK